MLIRNKSALIYLLFFLSGFSALIYEVVWLRKLELVFGTTNFAVSTVLAVFFTGLAVGSWVFGRIADNANDMRMPIVRMNANKKGIRIDSQNFNLHSISIKPILLYGLLELGIGLYALLTPWIFVLIGETQALVWQQFSPGFGGFSAVTFLLSFVGLFLPTVLMGGTFPVAVKATTRLHLSGGNERTPERWNGEVVGWLYGLNTLGAVLGVLAAGFFLIASFGVNQTIWVAAGISLVVGGISLYLSHTFSYT